MKRLTFAALGALALGGCTGTHIKPPAVCDGKHRRPANLYGSILPTLPVPLPVSQMRGQSMEAPGPGAGPGSLPAPPPELAPSLTPDTGGLPALPGQGPIDTHAATPRTSQRSTTLPDHSC
jgi:hypothetical protein